MAIFKSCNPKMFYYGSPCKQGHCQADGKNPRRYTGICEACGDDYPPGPYKERLDGCWEKRSDIPRNKTPEQIEAQRLRHIKAVKKWNKNNKEATEKYQLKYRAKPEIAEKMAKIELLKYYIKKSNDPEEIKEFENEILAIKYAYRKKK